MDNMLSRMLLFLATGTYLLALPAGAVNFPYESTQLTETDARDLSYLSFGNASAIRSYRHKEPRCKIQPGDEAWPSDNEWASFNKTVGGRLLKPTPPGAVCYQTGESYDVEQCAYLVEAANETRFFLDDPVSALTGWAQGNTCNPTLSPIGDCTQGGFPTYVVNATTVKDIQATVNFARNTHIRLVIKTTGHDFCGKSTAHASLSIWLHHLKGVEYLENYSVGEYDGRAIKLSAGTEAWEINNLVAESGNFSVVTSGAPTVGQSGGWALGGGHGALSGLLGLGADQILSLNVVTADGRFITVSPDENTDLFFALRGGGGGTFGIVTSSIFKAYPDPQFLTGFEYSFTTGPIKTNATTIGSFEGGPSIDIKSIDTFWEVYRQFLRFSEKASIAGGFTIGDLENIGNNSYTFASTFFMPNLTTTDTAAFLEPLFATFRTLGVNITTPTVDIKPYSTVADPGTSAPDFNDKFFASRLFPKDNWADEALFNDTVGAIRRAVEAAPGMLFRGRSYSPWLKAAGYPSSKIQAGVNPAFRQTRMHAALFPPDYSPDDGLSRVESWRSRYALLSDCMEPIRTVTAGSGAYLNEADPLEPDWQKSLFGDNYGELLKVKRHRDPWGLFWTSQRVGSEGWEVITEDGIPSQNGPLCRTDDKE